MVLLLLLLLYYYCLFVQWNFVQSVLVERNVLVHVRACVCVLVGACVLVCVPFSPHGRGNPVYKGYYSVFHFCLFIFHKGKAGNKSGK